MNKIIVCFLIILFSCSLINAENISSHNSSNISNVKTFINTSIIDTNNNFENPYRYTRLKNIDLNGVNLNLTEVRDLYEGGINY